MINGCRADGLPEPEFDIQPSMFSITFRIRNNDGENRASANGSVNGSANGSVKNIEKQIMELMSGNPNITIQQIADALRTTTRRINNYIKVLKETGIIERVGADKKGYWVVKGKLRNH